MPDPKEIEKQKSAADDYFSASSKEELAKAEKDQKEQERLKKIYLETDKKNASQPTYSLPPSSSEVAKKIKAKFNSLRDKKATYTESPTYLERLKKTGVKNPAQVQKERAELERGVQDKDVNVLSSSMAGSTHVKSKSTGSGVDVQISPDASDETIMHEIGHITNRYATNYPNSGQGSDYAAPGSAAPVEDWHILNRSKLAKERIGELYSNFKKEGTAKINPVISSPRPKNVSQEDVMLRGAEDTHYSDAGEMKSDLDAVRLILNKAGITKKYGESITPEQLQKAMKTKGVGDKPHFQRMLKNFNPDKIVELNNNVAQNAPQNKQDIA